MKARSAKDASEGWKYPLAKSDGRKWTNAPGAPFHSVKLKAKQKLEKARAKGRKKFRPNRLIERQKKLAQWAVAVRRSFGDCCVACGMRDDPVRGFWAPLHAHHILPKSQYPQHMFSLENGIPLCASCHVIVHQVLKQDPALYHQLVKDLRGESRDDVRVAEPPRQKPPSPMKERKRRAREAVFA